MSIDNRTFYERASELAEKLDPSRELSTKLYERLINNLVDKLSARDMIDRIEKGQYRIKKSGSSFLYIYKDSS